MVDEYEVMPERQARLRDVLAHRQPGLTLVLENLYDPHNVAAILRSSDAVGVLDINLLYYIEQFPDFERHGKQSSAGARKWIGRPQYTTVPDCYGALRAKGYKIYAAALDVNGRDLYDLDLTGNVALAFGNERRGLSPEAIAQADGCFQIPMVGMVQSLNVSVAVAVSLYEAFRQRKKAGLYDKPALAEAELERLYAEWTMKRTRKRDKDE